MSLAWKLWVTKLIDDDIDFDNDVCQLSNMKDSRMLKSRYISTPNILTQAIFVKTNY